jgi:glycogen debranching enzyme
VKVQALNLAETLVIKHGNVFMITPRDGRVPAGGAHPFGLWWRDCRFLSAHELTLAGERPAPVASTDAAGGEAVYELAVRGGAVHIRVVRTVEPGGALRERITLESHGPELIRVPLELRIAADFLPMLELRGLVPARQRPVESRAKGFSTRGRDGVLRSTRVRTSPELCAAADGSLVFELELRPRVAVEVAVDFELAEQGPGAVKAAEPTRPSPGEQTRASTGDQLLDGVLERSLNDLRMLRSELDGHPYYAAGIPWFATLFGRDSLIAALQTLAFTPDVAEGTLRVLAGRLGQRCDGARDEEPGKVVHELRVGEPAALGETPFAAYYGSADATPLFLCLLCEHASWTGSLDLFRELRGPVDAALGWIGRYGDLDGDGLVEYRRRAPKGLETQGWKDSPGGVPDDLGRPLTQPVALVEVQGYVVRAKRELARLFEIDGDGSRAGRLRDEAAALAAQLERFRADDRGGYAIGLDAEKRPGSALSSNQGHLLWSGAVGTERAAAIRDALMGPELFSGWGVRTLGPGNPAYDPLGYHVGSVWPHDSALIADGLRRYGFDEEFGLIFDGLLAAAAGFADHRLPELFGGHSREETERPVPYPVACRPQAWAAGSIPFLLTSALGLRPDAGKLHVVRPVLPRGVDRVELTGLRVGDALIDLTFERAEGGEVRVTNPAGGRPVPR